MKKALATICLIGSTLALGACEGSGDVQTKTPYDRTAVYAHGEQTAPAEEVVTPAEPVFQKSQNK